MRALLVLLVLLLTAAPADAQFRRAPKFAEKGDVALVVELAGLDVFALRPALSGVGVRYRVADQTVLGGSLGLGLTDESVDTDQQGQESDSDRQATNVRLSTWVEQHIGVRSRYVSPFVGAGLQVSVLDQSDETVQELNTGGGESVVVRREIASDGYALGGGLLLGAEVRLAKGITVGGAYTLGVDYRRSEDRVTFTGPEDVTPPDVRQDRSVLRAGTGVTDLVFSVTF